MSLWEDKEGTVPDLRTKQSGVVESGLSPVIMGFREYYDRLIEMLVTGEKADDILAAKEEFWKLTGKVHDGEPYFERRMSAFFDWYVFDRYSGWQTPLENLLAQGSVLSEDEKNIYKGFLNNIHSIFIVKKMAPDGMKINDLFTNISYTINGDDASLGFYQDAVFEGRIFPYENGFYLSPSLCFHPKDSREIIKHVLKMARKEGNSNILPLIHRLAHMNLKWETYRNIKVKDIYKFEEYGERRWWQF